MAGKHYVYGVAANLDLSSVGNGLDADGTKLYCTTMAKNVADRAMQVGLQYNTRGRIGGYTGTTVVYSYTPFSILWLTPSCPL